MDDAGSVAVLDPNLMRFRFFTQRGEGAAVLSFLELFIIAKGVASRKGLLLPNLFDVCEIRREFFRSVLQFFECLG